MMHEYGENVYYNRDYIRCRWIIMEYYWEVTR